MFGEGCLPGDDGTMFGARLPRALIAISVAVVTACASAIAPATADEPVPTDPAAVAPAPVAAPAMPAALGSWCEPLHPSLGPKKDRQAAWDLMAGKAKMSQGGTYIISEHPDWQPQAGTDTSGDRHVNSLNWALPLLYRGVKVQDQAMVNRFAQLMHYWVADHQGPRGVWVDGSIYGGFRTGTLLCAAQTLNDPVLTEAALRDARTMVARNWGASGKATGVNNTDLIRQMAALATFCWVGDIPMRDRAWANLLAVARGLVYDDGSDVEGSPGYAVYAEKLLGQASAVAAQCGIPTTEIDTVRNRQYDFVSQAIAPDFRISSLGDTADVPLRKSFGAGDPRAEWVRSQGTAGTPPQPIYTAYEGGYVFGRAGWQPQPGLPDTYYSLRFSGSRPATPHTHDDGTSLSLYSRGTWWIDDPGPYRYDNASSMRSYVKSRDAHSGITVNGVKRSKSAGVVALKTTSDWQSGGNDTSCVQDRTWGKVVVTRCVQYIRSVDAMVVVDYVKAPKGKKGRVVNERWMIAPKLSATNTSDVVTLASDNKRMDITKSGPGGWNVRVADGSSSQGWFTGSWGEKVPGSILWRPLRIPKKGIDEALVTVFTPRLDGENVPVVIADGNVTITRNGQTVTTPLPAP